MPTLAWTRSGATWIEVTSPTRTPAIRTSCPGANPVTSVKIAA